ncbi:MAG: hypothetical protein WD768_06810 [Phycisphaeraceae bacterium]
MQNRHIVSHLTLALLLALTFTATALADDLWLAVGYGGGRMN